VALTRPASRSPGGAYSTQHHAVALLSLGSTNCKPDKWRWHGLRPWSWVAAEVRVPGFIPRAEASLEFTSSIGPEVSAVQGPGARPGNTIFRAQPGSGGVPEAQESRSLPADSAPCRNRLAAPRGRTRTHPGAGDSARAGTPRLAKADRTAGSGGPGMRARRAAEEHGP
jgi:hypothetical protein